MRLPPFPFVVLDTETTGFFPRTDRVLELALLRYEGGEKIAEYDSLFSVDCSIPPHVQVLTRIRAEHLQGKPSLKDESPKIQQLMRNAVIVGHNIQYDLSMLAGEGLVFADSPWIDSAMLASLLFPECESWSLGYLSTVLPLPHKPKHRALGDVHATVALLAKIWERLEELPMDLAGTIKSLAERGPKGYATLFSSLAAQGKQRPSWLHCKGKTERMQRDDDAQPVCAVEGIASQEEPMTTLLSAPLSPYFLSSYLQHSLGAHPQRRVWIAVKNLEVAMRTLPTVLLDQCTILSPPHALLDPASKERLYSQPSFTADELTLALKFVLFEPRQAKELPLHGGEHDVWSAKIACTAQSSLYREQFATKKATLLIDHRQLLDLLQQEKGPQSGDAVVVDDASMLEDTATKASRFLLSIATLRAGAEGGETALVRFLDLLQIWLEKVRNDLVIRYLVEADLRMSEVRGLRERLEELFSLTLPEHVREQLQDLQKMLDPRHLEGRITWVEQFRDGGQVLQSVPLDIASLLWDALYDKFSTTLLLPPGGRELFPGIISPRMDVCTAGASVGNPQPPLLRYAERELTLERLLPCVDGKVIVLVGSKGMIEQLFIRFAERMEEEGTTLIAQGFNGGLGRMQAEFIAAEGPVAWLLTPWMYEGVELPSESVDRLFLATLPFDHPSHAVLSQRAGRFGNPFEEYFFPRLLHRLFRIFRTYELHRKCEGDILLLDDRIRTKNYGEKVREYLKLFTANVP